MKPKSNILKYGIIASVIVIALIIFGFYIVYPKLDTCENKLFGTDQLTRQYSFEKISEKANQIGYDIKRDERGSFVVSSKDTEKYREFRLTPPPEGTKYWIIGMRYGTYSCHTPNITIIEDAQKFLSTFEIETDWLKDAEPYKNYKDMGF